MESNKLLAHKKGIITGVVNNNSMAWGIAKFCKLAGADITLTYPNSSIKKRVVALSEELGATAPLELDVVDEISIKSFTDNVASQLGKIDFVVHSIAFTDKKELRGRYLDTTRDNFLNTMDVSVFSLTRLLQCLEPFLNPGSSALTLSYYGAEKVVPNYNVMGVAKASLEASVRYLAFDLGKTGGRLNTISAGPVKTLAASGIGNFRNLLKWSSINSPLGKGITIDQVGSVAAFLLSDYSSGITGEVVHVDSGYNTVGIVPLENMNLQ